MFTPRAYKAFSLTKRTLSLRVPFPRPLTVQDIPCRLLSGVSSLDNSFAQKAVGEILVKKSVRVKHIDHGPPGEKLRAIFTHDGDRKLWISISGKEPTEEDQVQKLPKSKQKRVVRQLEVSEDGEVDDKGYYLEAVVYKVTERKGAGARRFWREVLSFDWDEFAEEEGWYEEITRQMNKSF